MISVLFIVCNLQGQCFTASYQGVFREVIQCEVFAETTILENQRQAEKAGNPRLIARYKCIDWGKDA